MRTVHTIAEVRATLAGKANVGLVATMGAFHEGHLSLIRAARVACDTVVVSLFVNPTQFGEAADLAAYPRTEAEDAVRAEAEGVDVLFVPAVAEMYPEGFATTVEVAGLSEVFEGAARPGHFAGVCTVVAKLLNIVGPDIAFFGQKDAQQVAVVRRMVRDLDIPVRLQVEPTVRDPDGLALSSRNRHLSPAERERALGLSRALRAAADAAARGERDADAIRAAALTALDGLRPDYLAVVDPDTFEPVRTARGRVLVAVAARIGATHLIDNAIVEPAATPTGAPTT